MKITRQWAMPSKHTGEGTDPFGCLHAYDCENHPPIVEEYIRKGAFIDKACKWLKENIDHYAYNKDFVSLNEFIRTFHM